MGRDGSAYLCPSFSFGGNYDKKLRKTNKGGDEKKRDGNEIY
jgi:hypothetical protein